MSKVLQYELNQTQIVFNVEATLTTALSLALQFYDSIILIVPKFYFKF